MPAPPSRRVPSWALVVLALCAVAYSARAAGGPSASSLESVEPEGGQALKPRMRRAQYTEPQTDDPDANARTVGGAGAAASKSNSRTPSKTISFSRTTSKSKTASKTPSKSKSSSQGASASGSPTTSPAIAGSASSAVTPTPALSSAAPTSSPVSASFSVNVPPRQMWGWGPSVPGYCGETSLQSAGLFYGNWITQEAVLQACGTVSAGQCLVNVNEEGAATALAFNIARFAPSGPTAYLNFIKTHLAAGHPIIGTWYEAGATDPDYDHITPITGCTVDATGAVTSLTYNDLYLSTPRTVSIPAAVKSRGACSSNNPVQPFTYCIPSVTDYALAITGNNDPLTETFPTSLDVGSWSEPDWGSEDSYHTPYPPAVFTPTATVTGLTVGNTYSLLRFDGAPTLPAGGGFLASNRWAVRVDFVATSATMTLSGLASILSNKVYCYRTVAGPSTGVSASASPSISAVLGVSASVPASSTATASPSLSPSTSSAVAAPSASNSPSISIVSGATVYSVTVPPRLQWGLAPSVPGYCGECSLQSAGLFYGNWITQEAVLQACDTVYGGQCLVGGNEEGGALTLAFTITPFQGSTTAYLNFIKTNIAAGHPVIGTWYVAGGTYSQYDHITPITGVAVNAAGAVTSLTFNDLFNPNPLTINVATGEKSRSGCNSNQALDYCIPSDTPNFALAITGITDPLHELFPTSLDVGSNTEPDWGSEDSYHAPYPPATFTPTATVSGLTVGNTYSLLRFDGASTLPAGGGFLASNRWAVRVSFVATSSKMTLTGLASILSNKVYFYRTVLG